MNKAGPYILQLKEAKGYSWNQCSEVCRVPASTIRSYASGSVAQPSYQTLFDIVTGLGGSLDELYATPESVRSEMLEVRKIEAGADEDLKVTIRTLREAKDEMVQSVRESYERQIIKTEEEHVREIVHLKESYHREIEMLKRSNRGLKIATVAMMAALLLVLVVVIGILAYDITHAVGGM